MEADLPVPLAAARVVIPGEELWFIASRSGGPGGQAVNTSSTRVMLHWVVTTAVALDEVQRLRVLTRLANRIDHDGVLRVTASDGRSQLQNREAARVRLADLVATALHVAKRRTATRPTKGSVERRHVEKQQRSAVKKDRRRTEE